MLLGIDTAVDAELFVYPLFELPLLATPLLVSLLLVISDLTTLGFLCLDLGASVGCSE